MYLVLQVTFKMLHLTYHMITLPLDDQVFELVQDYNKTDKVRYSSIKLELEQKHPHCSALSSNGPYRNCLSALQLLNLGSVVQSINVFNTVCSAKYTAYIVQYAACPFCIVYFEACC